MDKLGKAGKITVNRVVSSLERELCIVTQNFYEVKNDFEDVILYAQEDSGYLKLTFMGSLRSFQLSVCDIKGQPVFSVIRPINLNPFKKEKVKIVGPSGNFIGYLIEKKIMLNRKFRIITKSGDVILSLGMPQSKGICSGNTVIQVFNSKNVEIGQIRNDVSGDFEISFYDHLLDVKSKIMTLSVALFLAVS